MRISFGPRNPDRIEFGLIYGTIALIALIAARVLPLLAIAPSCTFRWLTGFPCPTCGTTRSLVHLAHGNFLAALALNPLASTVLVVALLALAYDAAGIVFRIPQLGVSLSAFERTTARILIILLVFANWAYLIMTL